MQPKQHQYVIIGCSNLIVTQLSYIEGALTGLQQVCYKGSSLMENLNEILKKIQGQFEEYLEQNLPVRILAFQLKKTYLS